MTDQDRDRLAAEAEARWLDGWSAGPTEPPSVQLPVGVDVADVELLDHNGAQRSLSEFWAQGPALVMFWRHFGCGCGVLRAERLRDEWAGYLDAGLQPVIIGQGDPGRASDYRAEQGLEATILCDPALDVYRTWGLGHWTYELIMFTDPPPDYLADPRAAGEALQNARRQQGRPPVDDPWRAVGEYVVGSDGRLRLGHTYAHCIDFPDAADLVAAVTG